MRGAAGLCLAAVAFVPGAWAQGRVRLVGACSVPPGATTALDVEAIGFDRQIAAARVTIEFDAAKLSVSSVTDPATGPYAGSMIEWIAPSPGRLALATIDCDADPAGPTSPAVATVRLVVLAPAGTTIPIRLISAEALDADGRAPPTVLEDYELRVVAQPDRDCDTIPDVTDNCPDRPHPNQSDSNGNGIGDACEALLAKFESFSARRSGTDVEVAWKTSSELDMVGFHLYRGSSNRGPWVRLTTAMIPARGSELEGASYSFIDRDVPQGRQYYLIEEIETDGSPGRYGPIEATGRGKSVKRAKGSADRERRR